MDVVIRVRRMAGEDSLTIARLFLLFKSMDRGSLCYTPERSWRAYLVVAGAVGGAISRARTNYRHAEPPALYIER
jgi:hypothetical protein